MYIFREPELTTKSISWFRMASLPPFLAFPTTAKAGDDLYEIAAHASLELLKIQISCNYHCKTFPRLLGYFLQRVLYHNPAELSTDGAKDFYKIRTARHFQK